MKKTASKKTNTSKAMEKTFLDTFPKPTVDAAVAAASEYAIKAKDKVDGDQVNELLRDAFLYGVVYAFEERERDTKNLRKKARVVMGKLETAVDEMDDDDSFELSSDELNEAHVTILNLVRAIEVHPDTEDDDEDEPRIATKRVNMEAVAGAGKDAVIASLRGTIAKLEGADMALHTVIEKFIRILSEKDGGY